MKTIKILSILIFVGCCSANAQNVQSTSSRTSGGLEAGGATSGTGNTFYGYQAGKVTTSTGLNNTFIGHQAGKSNTTGDNNVFVGVAGINTTTGSDNIFIGSCGYDNFSGSENIFIGSTSGQSNGSGLGNVYLGQYTGGENGGSYNTFLGYQAGGEAAGSNNVLIGSNAGYLLNDSNKLFVDNTDTSSPLIWGDFALDQLKFNGKVGIGNGFGNYPTTAGSVDVSAYNLFVKGGILTEEVRVMLQANWADYVFTKDYKLPTLSEVEAFIAKNGHLPNVPSAQQVKDDGIDLGEMAKIQQEKIEELTLYIIEQNKTNEEQNKEIQELKRLVEILISKK